MTELYGIKTESSLVKHALREFSIIGEDPEIVRSIAEILQIFSDMGHSGTSAEVTIDLLVKLMSYENISPLTDDPNEWNDVTDMMPADSLKTWQNRRNSKCFSPNGGKSYFDISDESRPNRWDMKELKDTIRLKGSS